MNYTGKSIGILVGGGPAPGINSVIGAATIRSILGGASVVGILDGFKWIMEGDSTKVKSLSIEEVSRIHFHGGSYLGIARANPTMNSAHLDNALAALLKLKQPEISKIEHRTDMYISTLRGYIRAMGGDLEIVARFPDGEVKIANFGE